jgi:hypothetical protein
MLGMICSRLRRRAGVAGLAALTTAFAFSLGGSCLALGGGLNYTPLIAADWQPPAALPRAFRNHCHFDGEGRFYCSNHCGLDYQFYFCTPASFGCCRPGFGYCDWKGHLRCAPW